MADIIYNSFKKNILTSSINLSSDTIRCVLVSGYTPNVSSHAYYTDITNEVTGVGYTTSGVALSGKTVTQNNSLSASIFDADDVTWSGSTISATAAVLFKDTGYNATSPLIVYVEFVGGVQISNLSNFQVLWNSNGIFKLGQI